MAPARPRSAYNAAHDLIAVANQLRREISADVEQQGFEGLRPSFAPAFSQVWERPLSQTELADRLGVSLAAVSQLVTLAERLGYLVRRPDHLDGRVRRIELTARGRQFTREGVRAVVRFASRVERALGEQRYTSFDSTLSRLLRELGAAETTRLVTGIDERASIVSVVVIAEMYIRQLGQAVIDGGFRDLGGRENTVLVSIGDGGAQASDLARARGVTRQAVTATLHQLEALGYVRRKRDRGSKGVLFVHTARGARLISVYVGCVDDIERRAVEMLGRRRFNELAATAQLLRQAHPQLQVDSARRRLA